MSTEESKHGDSQAQNQEDDLGGSPFTRQFLLDRPIRIGTFAGKKGYFITIRLTSYRSLPLSCIEKVELSVDGKAVAPEAITFVLNGFGMKPSEFVDNRHIFWWILDPAELFVEDAQGLPEGEHVVEGDMVVIEPYITAGRGAFPHPSKKHLSVETPL